MGVTCCYWLTRVARRATIACVYGNCRAVGDGSTCGIVGALSGGSWTLEDGRVRRGVSVGKGVG